MQVFVKTEFGEKCGVGAFAMIFQKFKPKRTVFAEWIGFLFRQFKMRINNPVSSVVDQFNDVISFPVGKSMFFRVCEAYSLYPL